MTEHTSLSYIKVDLIAKKVVQLGKGTQLAKMDIEEAYRLAPIHPDDKHLLGIKWTHTLTLHSLLVYAVLP